MVSKGDYDYLVKVLIIGDSGVGKTCFLLRFTENQFQSNHLATIGIDFKIKTIDVDGRKIKMQIWDTAGQERFKTITQTYYKGAMGIILTYAVDDRDSFKNIENWMRQIKLHASENVCRILVGNKADVPERTIETAEGQRLADTYGIKFFETSAKNNMNIENAFNSIAKEIKEKILSEPTPNKDDTQSQMLNDTNNNKKPSGGNCC